MKKKILMVCLGNICRSPLADGLLKAKANNAGLELEIDSCGTNGLHDGESPDKRTQANALQNGLDLSPLRSRQISPSDIQEYDLIYCMDQSNLSNVRSMASNQEELNKIELILNVSNPGSDSEVPDPYFGGESGFQNVYNLLDEACEAIIHKLQSS